MKRATSCNEEPTYSWQDDQATMSDRLLFHRCGADLRCMTQVMASLKSIKICLVIGLWWGSAYAAEVDQTGTVSGPPTQDLNQPPVDPTRAGVTASATFRELKVNADTRRRGFFAVKKDKPWDPGICIGC